MVPSMQKLDKINYTGYIWQNNFAKPKQIAIFVLL